MPISSGAEGNWRFQIGNRWAASNRVRRYLEGKGGSPGPSDDGNDWRMIFMLQVVLRIAIMFAGVLGTVWLVITIDRWIGGRETWQGAVVFFLAWIGLIVFSFFLNELIKGFDIHAVMRGFKEAWFDSE